MTTTTVRLRGPVTGRMLYAVSKVASRILAPHFDTMEGLEKAIAKNRAAGTARPTTRMLKRFEYTERDVPGGRLLNLSRRGAGAPRLHFLYLHGGAFVLDLQRIQWAVPAGMLDHVRDADVTAAIYPLAPEATWRESTAFVRQVYLDMVDRYGAENIVVFGDSAGATFALLLACALRDEGLPQPAAMVLFSPVCDGTASAPELLELERRDPSLTVSLLHNCFSLWAPDIEPNDARISPLFASQEDLPPILMFSGDREILDSDARRLAAISPSVDHRSYVEMAHVFPMGGTKEAKHAFRETAKFISEHLVSDLTTLGES